MEKDFKPVGIQDAHIDRFADFTNETGKKYSYKISFLDKLFNESKLSEIASTETKNMSDEELMTMVQEASLIIIGTAQNRKVACQKKIPTEDKI
jgi:hypothetical protein